MLVLLMDECHIMSSSYVTEFYAAGSVCTLSVYIYHLRWAGFIPAKITLCVSCLRRELPSAVHPAIIATAVSTSQLIRPAAAKKDQCGGEASLDCGRTRPQIRCKSVILDTTKSHRVNIFDMLARREVEVLTSVQEGRARRQTIVCT